MKVTLSFERRLEDEKGVSANTGKEWVSRQVLLRTLPKKEGDTSEYVQFSTTNENVNLEGFNKNDIVDVEFSVRSGVSKNGNIWKFLTIDSIEPSSNSLPVTQPISIECFYDRIGMTRTGIGNIGTEWKLTEYVFFYRGKNGDILIPASSFSDAFHPDNWVGKRLSIDVCLSGNKLDKPRYFTGFRLQKVSIMTDDIKQDMNSAPEMHYENISNEDELPF